jgi:two-component system response regulator PilR (NtrC family)
MEQSPQKVLVVDDNRSSATALGRLLERDGFDVEVVFDGQSAIDSLGRFRPDVVLTDLRMEPVGGLEVLKAAKAGSSDIKVIVFTAHGEVDTAVNAMRLGATDFLMKPVTLEMLSSRLKEARSGGTLASRSELLAGFVANSKKSRELLELLTAAGDVPSSVWIEGEIGSGRDYCARLLHAMSDPDAPLQVVDLVRDDAWPSEGTVVLGGLSDLTRETQRRLVRHLKRLGPNVRLITTAYPGAKQRVADGTLLSELYYRLAVIEIRVPPMRERKEDIVPLFDTVCRRFADRYGKEQPVVSETQYKSMVRHAWPGNVRELANLAERVAVLGSTALNLKVSRRHDDGLPELEEGFNLSAYLESIERKLLVEALDQCAGDRAAAGKLLSVERNTLRYKLNKYGLI